MHLPFHTNGSNQWNAQQILRAKLRSAVSFIKYCFFTSFWLLIPRHQTKVICVIPIVCQYYLLTIVFIYCRLYSALLKTTVEKGSVVGRLNVKADIKRVITYKGLSLEIIRSKLFYLINDLPLSSSGIFSSYTHSPIGSSGLKIELRMARSPAADILKVYPGDIKCTA